MPQMMTPALSDSDRKTIGTARARSLRARIAPMLAMIKMQQVALSGSAPSYVIESASDAVAMLSRAFDRWAIDESTVPRVD